MDEQPNLLVSYRWREFFPAQKEIHKLLEKFGDPKPIIQKTLAKGIAQVTTSLDNREVIKKIKKLFQEKPKEIKFTLKWVPVDHWCSSDLEEMKSIIKKIKKQIKPKETWGMDIEKRRYTLYHSQEIIERLAPLIKQKVNLDNPNKILRIDILGKKAVITVLKPEEIFSAAKE